ncbi:hypothetical protein AM493_13490 [Flavobacterium akiainvivens]|uniref:Uncharacterized protein n=1 Tax=Flavobacterium akiainvivens TaxID=1202724 RepID=A0A0M8MII5_9FLAO|nr:hypothetical protein [Flavobacterium akiainvivens]KOS06931.1 hypothetical protein AM493_13490 [Flavobacterium akiainvivens]SFQ69931.1 hypothetical protein SAMN05444144_11590 [Flavobacterium akiainvivens]
MNGIEDIIHLLKTDDKKAFASYLRKKDKRGEGRSVQLFKIIETDDINTLKKLYPGENNDAYHALRKRLYDNLVEFMANQTFTTSTAEAHEVLRLLVVSRFFLEHRLTKTAFKCLAKAEARAIPLEQFSLLNEIYHTQIQYAHLNPALDLDGVIAKFRTNRERLYREEQLNTGYALLRRELHDIQLKGKVVDFREFIQGTMNSLGISLNEALTFKSLYQILFIANEYASLNHNFTLVEPFVEKSYAFIQNRADEAPGQLYYHIYVLYFLANINLRNHRFAESNIWLNRMEAEMQKQNSRYYSRFTLRHQLLRALNANFSGNPQQAIDSAEKALKNASHKADAQDVADLTACLAMFWVQQEDRAAYKYMKLLHRTDAWYEKKLGMLWAIRKNLLEILMYAGFGESEMALSRLKSFKRRYKKYLAQVNEQRVYDYALLIERYILKPEIAQHPGFKKGIVSLLNPDDKEDIFVVSFVGWLLARAERRPVYEATLRLL